MSIQSKPQGWILIAAPASPDFAPFEGHSVGDLLNFIGSANTPVAGVSAAAIVRPGKWLEQLGSGTNILVYFRPQDGEGMGLQKIARDQGWPIFGSYASIIEHVEGAEAPNTKRALTSWLKPAKTNFDGYNSVLNKVIKDSPFMVLPGKFANDPDWLDFVRGLSDLVISKPNAPEAEEGRMSIFDIPGVTLDPKSLFSVSGMAAKPWGVIPFDNAADQKTIAKTLAAAGDSQRAAAVERMVLGDVGPADVMARAKAMAEFLVPSKIYSGFAAKRLASTGGQISQASIVIKKRLARSYLRDETLGPVYKAALDGDVHAARKLETDYLISFVTLNGYRFQGDHPDKHRLVQSMRGKYVIADKGGIMDSLGKPVSDFSRCRARPVAQVPFGAALPLRGIATGLVRHWKKLLKGLKLTNASGNSKIIEEYLDVLVTDVYQHDRFAPSYLLLIFTDRIGEIYGKYVGQLAKTILTQAIMAKTSVLGKKDVRLVGDPYRLDVAQNRPGNPSGHPFTYLFATFLTIMYWGMEFGKKTTNVADWMKTVTDIFNLKGKLGALVTGDNLALFSKERNDPYLTEVSKLMSTYQFPLGVPEETPTFAGNVIVRTAGGLRMYQNPDGLLGKLVNPMRSLISPMAGSFELGWPAKVSLYSEVPGMDYFINGINELARAIFGRTLDQWAADRATSKGIMESVDNLGALMKEVLEDADKLVWKYSPEEFPAEFIQRVMRLHFITFNNQEAAAFSQPLEA